MGTGPRPPNGVHVASNGTAGVSMASNHIASTAMVAATRTEEELHSATPNAAAAASTMTASANAAAGAAGAPAVDERNGAAVAAAAAAGEETFALRRSMRKRTQTEGDGPKGGAKRVSAAPRPSFADELAQCTSHRFPLIRFF